jgi:hypothetical protein
LRSIPGISGEEIDRILLQGCVAVSVPTLLLETNT